MNLEDAYTVGLCMYLFMNRTDEQRLCVTFHVQHHTPLCSDGKFSSFGSTPLEETAITAPKWLFI